MEKVVQVFSSFEEAERADAQADLRLTPEQRIEIVLKLREQMYPDASQQGLARVCRVTTLEQS